MLPKNAFQFYISNLKWCWEESYTKEQDAFIITDEDKQYFKEELGLLNLDSAFIDFYTVVAIPIVGKGSELHTLEKIIETSESSEYSDISGMNNFLRLSSIEGEGSYFYNKATDQVFDVSWGEELDLVEGKLKPISSTFYDFLEWYYSDK
jgi:hypothetical protein